MVTYMSLKLPMIINFQCLCRYYICCCLKIFYKYTLLCCT